MNPPKHLNALTIDPSRILLQQHRNRAVDIVRQANPAERRLRGNWVIQVLVILLGTAAEVGFNRAWRDSP